MPDGEQQYQSYEERQQAAREHAGYDENATGMVGGIRNVVASVQATVAANEAREREAARLARSAEFRDGAPTSNVDYQGYDHTALQAMLAEVDSAQIGAMSTPWTNLANAMAEFSDDLNTAVNKSKAVWQGEAADTAHGFSSSMSTWSEGTGQSAQLASDRMVSQSESASTAKNSMPEPIPFSWSQEIQSWGSNPINIVGAVQDSFAKQRASQDAKDEGVRVMTTYDGGLHGTASQSPAFAEPPSLSGSSGATDTTGSDISGRGSGTPTVNGPGGAGSTGASGYSGGPGGSAGNHQAPGGYTGPSGGSGGSGTSGTPSYTPPTPPQPGRQTGSAESGGTRAAAFNPSTVNSSLPGSGTDFGGAAAGGAFGPMPVGGLAGSAGGAGGGDFGPTGGGRAGGPGGPNAAGRLTGAAAPSPMGGAHAAGAAGAPGARGGAGGGMMGAGGGRGQGAEDKEHQRKYGLDTELEVDLHVKDEHGERMIDPVTGMPVVPPVIGE